LLARTRAQAKLDRTQRDLESTESALAEQSVIDTLSKLHNKKYFLQRGDKELSIATRHGQDLTLFCVELDRFTQIEYAYGEDCAKSLIQWAAQRIFGRLRKEDTVARIDNSRFAVLAPMTGRLDAAVLCERLRNEFVSLKFEYSNKPLPVTVSLGLVNLGKDNADKFENLLEVAQQRAQEAAANGGNRVIATTRGGRSQAANTEQQQLSLDSVARVLRKGNVEVLTPHVKAIAALLMPILEFCNKTLRWNLDAEINKIKSRVIECADTRPK
jgi:diguanylate cyclase (GGDEF)-like protein